jgi:hypothetical protein
MRIKLLILSGLLCLSATAKLSAASVILNEYNAVGSQSRLDDGAGRDSFFGTIFGNGGNWLELLVVDNVDLRGWSLEWHENEMTQGGETATGTITFADNELWSNVRRGTILTLIETADAGGQMTHNTSTDTSFNADAGDWWINVSTREEQAKGAAGLVSSVTNHGAPGDFSTGNNDWYLTIFDAQQNTVFGPVGEGAAGWTGPGINNTEGVALEGPQPFPPPTSLETWQSITPTSEFYDDTGSTSFGSLNQGYDPVTQTFTPRQDLSALRGEPVGPTPGDFNEDGQLTVEDINLLSAEVRAGTNNVQFDLNNDASVNDADRTVWVTSLRNTYFGDADLNGQFNSGDLVTVLASGTYETGADSGWGEGDFDGDGRTGSSDLVAALADGGYEAGPRGAVAAAVPEPSSMALAAAASLALLAAWRIRR